jgi:cell cycle arrest protein BUB2
MAPSPTKEPTPGFALTAATTLNPPTSPESQRTLRRLRSAQNLSTRTTNQPSLISQQRLQLQSQQRSLSPTKRNVSNAAGINRSPQRGRANSDATALGGPLTNLPARRIGLNKRSLAADGLSLERLIRDGPVDGDIDGSLESARTKILDLGIKSDGDGMVCAWPCLALGR